MTEEQRIADARELVKGADVRLQETAVVPDPVYRRRRLVQVASELRAAADLLDDQEWRSE